jgi:pentatricopeptide repeat protein
VIISIAPYEFNQILFTMSYFSITCCVVFFAYYFRGFFKRGENINKCLELLQKGEIEKALSVFDEMNRKSKLSFFSTLQTHDSSPKTLSLLVRKLRDGAAYEDFYKA